MLIFFRMRGHLLYLPRELEPEEHEYFTCDGAESIPYKPHLNKRLLAANMLRHRLFGVS